MGQTPFPSFNQCCQSTEENTSLTLAMASPYHVFIHHRAPEGMGKAPIMLARPTLEAICIHFYIISCPARCHPMGNVWQNIYCKITWNTKGIRNKLQQTRTRNPYTVAGVSLPSSCVDEHPLYTFSQQLKINKLAIWMWTLQIDRQRQTDRQS